MASAAAAERVQIGVAIEPGSITITWMPHGRSSSRSVSLSASTACFDAAYGPMNGRALRPAIEPMLTTRPGPRRRAGQQRLRHRQLADHVDLELAAQLVERDELERDRDRDAGVVDEPVQRLVGDGLGCGRDVVGIRDVEHQRLEPCCAEAFGVLVAPDARQHAPAGAAQVQRARFSDPRRGAGDEDGSSQGALRRLERGVRRRSPRTPGSTAPACTGGGGCAPR